MTRLRKCVWSHDGSRNLQVENSVWILWKVSYPNKEFTIAVYSGSLIVCDSNENFSKQNLDTNWHDYLSTCIAIHIWWPMTPMKPLMTYYVSLWRIVNQCIRRWFISDHRNLPIDSTDSIRLTLLIDRRRSLDRVTVEFCRSIENFWKFFSSRL